MDTYKNESAKPVELSNRRSLPPTLSEDFLFLRICVPDLNVQKCFQFSKTQQISTIKEQCISSLPMELKQNFNYGLFCPPVGTKCGKFLDEEKALNEYQFADCVGYLELRYKQRIYKTQKIDEKQFKAVNTRSNLRRFIDYIHNGQVEKITKLCAKGLDPNFHCIESGETPLTLATSLTKPGKVIMNLVNGGAFLDFRNLDGTTAVHRAVENNNLEAVITLLELGASPNYKDARALTPLYLSITRKTDVLICERLLRENASIGAHDVQGWQEIHQACRYGLMQHLEHLLFYGADMNARNASGNTPLHVCAVNGQEACARLLLSKGALNDSLNFANQTPYQMAVIAGNLDLATVIQNHRNSEVDKVIYDSSDVISNNSSGIGTANSDFNDSNLAIKANESTSSSASGTQDEGFSPLTCKSRASFSCYENTANELILPVYRPSKNMKDRAANTNKYYATAPRQKAQLPAEPRTVVLHKTKRGFGFILRGAKATSSLMEAKTSDVCPALQYLDDVDKGSVADLAGLRKGDYLLAINGEDVSTASHEQVVDLIRNSGELVTMTVVSRNPRSSPNSVYETKYTEWQTTAAPLGYATLPNKFRRNRSASSGHVVAPLPPRRDPKTTLSVGKAKSRNMIMKIGHWESDYKNCDPNSKDQPKTASIRSRPISSRITTAELEELFERQAELSPVYQEQFSRNKYRPKPLREKSELRRNFYSVPDLVQITVCNKAEEEQANTLRNHKSEDNVNGHDNPSPNTTASVSPQSGHSVNVKGKSKAIYVQHVTNATNKGVKMVSGVGPNYNTMNGTNVYVTRADMKDLRNQVRKSASVHTHNSSKSVRLQNGCGTQTLQPSSRHRAYQTRSVYGNLYSLSPPPIPDPDYSQSDEETECANVAGAKNSAAVVAYKTNTLPLPGNRGKNVKICPRTVVAAIDGSTTLRNFNVDDIRKARSLLKSPPTFQAYTTITTLTPNSVTEDGDNSSSGVSSDQEISSIPSSNNGKSVLMENAKLPSSGSVVTGDVIEKGELMVLPPPEYMGNATLAAVEVLEPPPQFSDAGS